MTSEFFRSTIGSPWAVIRGQLLEHYGPDLAVDELEALLNLGEPDSFDLAPWADRVQLTDAECDGPWELPVLGPVTAPAAVVIRPDGYVAWVGEGTNLALHEALTTWFGPPTVA